MRTLIKCLCLICVLGSWCIAQAQPLNIYWIDMEGGASTLIVTPAGESILIDAGGYEPDRDAARIYHVAADVAGLKQIDYFITTHWHTDHYGGAAKLTELIPLKRFYGHSNLPSAIPDDPKFSVLMPAYRKATQGHSQVLKAGETLPLKQAPNLPRLVVQCLASDGKVIPAEKASSPANAVCKKSERHPPDLSDNAKSIVLKLKYGRFAFLDGGDLTWNVEEQLVCPTNRVGTIDLFQVDHHGLDLSNNPVLLESICPRVVVVNNGPEKGAEPNTMKTLKGLPCIKTIWQVHRNVQRPESNTDSQFIANNEANCSGEFIKAAVEADGTFSVHIGQAGARKEYGRR